MNERAIALDDTVCRALGILRSARLLKSEETLFLLSHLRMGVNLGRVKEVDINKINELLLLTRPAHLQKILAKKMDGDVRRAARADFIRSRLNGN
jgi:protein arginine kinase